MKTMRFPFLIFWVIVFSSVSPKIVTAQTIYKFRSDSLQQKSQVRIGAWYTSDYIFMGRADSAKAPYLSPYVGYYHKSGFFVNGSMSYLTAAEEGRVDMLKLSGGYDYYRKKFEAGLIATGYIFNDYSYSILSEMSAFINGYVGYDLSGFMIYADGSLGFSENTDVFLGVEINRKFYAIKNKLRITPAVYINAGTQQYYSEYYTMRSTQTGQGHANGMGNSGSQTTSPNNLKVSESNKFELLDYEADLQISYKIKKVRLYISGTWTFPVNPATIVSDQGTYEEELKNRFYWATGIRCTL